MGETPAGQPPQARQRVDKWLFFARVVKSRSLGTKLAELGRVRINSRKTERGSDYLHVGDVLTLSLYEDAYKGDAEFTVSVDGAIVGGVRTTTGTKVKPQDVSLRANLGRGAHTVAIDFLNDLYEGPGKDRNLFMAGLKVDGTARYGFGDMGVGGVHSYAIQIDSAFAPAYNGRCAALTLKGEYDPAIADCSKAVELNPRYAAAFFNRAIASGRKGDFERAIADHSQAITLNAKYAKAYNGRAWAHLKAGNKVQAMADVQQALTLTADDAAALDTRAHVFEAMGKRNEAIADYRAALLKEPGLQSSLDGLKRLKAKP